jgi:hypothetical protein
VSSGRDDERTLSVGDVDGNVVQANSIDQVTWYGRDRRTVVLLALTLVVVLVAAAVIVWLVRKPDEPAFTGAPLDAAVAFSSAGCRSGYVVPDQDQASIPYTTTPASGVAGTGGVVTATLQGLSPASVVLQSVRAEVVSRRPAMPGLYLPSRCASDVSQRFFAVDLSEREPVAKPVQGVQNGQQVTAKDFPFKVDPTDVEQLVVQMDTPAEDVEFVLWVRWTSGGAKGEFLLGDKEKPFRITATTAAEPWCLDEVQDVWRPKCG